MGAPRSGGLTFWRATLLSVLIGVGIVIVLSVLIGVLFLRDARPRPAGDAPPVVAPPPIVTAASTPARLTVTPIPAQAESTATLIVPSATPSAAAPVGWQVGDQAPDFALADLEGRTVRLSDLRGQVVVLNFWATWCGYCAAEMTDLQAFNDEYQGRGIKVLALNDREDRDTAQNYRDEHGLALAILLDADGATGRAYHVSALPVTVFIDRAGLIRAVLVGQQQEQDFIDQADELL
jgi:peroxiredoxin